MEFIATYSNLAPLDPRKIVVFFLIFNYYKVDFDVRNKNSIVGSHVIP